VAEGGVAVAAVDGVLAELDEGASERGGLAGAGLEDMPLAGR
jgi:hypothetical protein